jgi:hypothetical protein
VETLVHWALVPFVLYNKKIELQFGFEKCHSSHVAKEPGKLKWKTFHTEMSKETHSRHAPFQWFLPCGVPC